MLQFTESQEIFVCLAFMLLNFLVSTLQYTESLIFVPESKK